MLRIPENNDMNEEQIMMHYDSLFALSKVNKFFIDISQELCPSGKVLDVGCGTGTILRGMKESYEKHGVDVSSNMIEYARSKSGDIEYKVGDGLNFPYADNSFDFVMSHSVIHHVKDVAGLVNEMLRVLKPDGALFVKDLCRPKSEHQLQTFFMDFLAKDYDSVNKKLFHDSLRASYTPDEFKGYFQNVDTSKLFFYNIAEKAAKGVSVDYEARQVRTNLFINDRLGRI